MRIKLSSMGGQWAIRGLLASDVEHALPMRDGLATPVAQGIAYDHLLTQVLAQLKRRPGDRGVESVAVAELTTMVAHDMASTEPCR